MKTVSQCSEMKQQLTRWKVQKLLYGFSHVLFLLWIVPREIPHTYRETERDRDRDTHTERGTDRQTDTGTCSHTSCHQLSSWTSPTSSLFIHLWTHSSVLIVTILKDSSEQRNKGFYNRLESHNLEHKPRKIIWS